VIYVNKDELIHAISADTGATQKNVEHIFSSFQKVIYDTLSTGEPVLIHGFGQWQVKPTAVRTARNLKTGEPLSVAAGKKVIFKVGKNLKSAITRNDSGLSETRRPSHGSK
jgi:DNA-binding protein HU-beta